MPCTRALGCLLAVVLGGCGGDPPSRPRLGAIVAVPSTEVAGPPSSPQDGRSMPIDDAPSGRAPPLPRAPVGGGPSAPPRYDVAHAGFAERW